MRRIRNLLKKPVFQAGNADWMTELRSITKQYNTTIHYSIKMNPKEASKKTNEKVVFNNLHDKRKKHKPKHKLDLVRTADIK